MNENKKFSISNMMLAFITVLVVIGLVALAGFFLLTPPDDIIMGRPRPPKFVSPVRFPDVSLLIVLAKAIR